MDAKTFWFTHWQTTIELAEKYPKFLEKLMIALKYNMTWEDFVRIADGRVR